jgi:hypothetical protein
LRTIQQDYDGEECKKSPTYAIAKPLHLRPDLLAGEFALKLPDLVGIWLGAQPLQPGFAFQRRPV